MPITKAETERGSVYNKDGAILHLPQGHELEPAVDEFMSRFNQAEPVYQPEHFGQHVRRIAEPFLSASKRSIVAATVKAKGFATTTTNALTPPPTVATAADRLGPEGRASFNAMGPGDRIAFINRANAVQLATILEQNGELVGLDDREREMATDRALRLYHVARAGLEGAHPAQPSLARIIVTGPDAKATEAAADAAMNDFVQRRDAVEDDERVAQGLVRFVAAILDEQPDRALDRLLSAA